MAGNHGDEYEGQVMPMKPVQKLDADDVRGRILVLPAVNYPAARAGRRVSPIDGGNLNRAFPGNPDGTPTQMLAHFIEQAILPGVDHAFDFHSRGCSLEYLPLAHVIAEQDSDRLAEARRFLEVFAMPISVIAEGVLDADQRFFGACQRAGVAHLSTELGGAGTITLDALRRADEGLLRLLAHVGALAPSVALAAAPPTVFYRRLPTRTYVYATAAGLFEPYVKLGDEVEAGEPAGATFFPETPWREPVVARFAHAGMVLSRRVPTQCEIGDCLFNLGVRLDASRDHPTPFGSCSMLMSPMLMQRRALLLGSLATALRSRAHAQPIARTTVSLTHAFTAHHLAMITELIRRFMEAQPAIAARTVTVADNWDPLLQLTLRNALVSDLPDLSHQNLNYARIFVNRGFAQPLDALAGGLDQLEAQGIPRTLVEPSRFQGRIYALPFGTALPVVYFNMSLLRRAGIADDRVPETWPAIIEAVAKVSALGSGVTGGYIEYTATNAWMFQNLLASLGGRMVDAGETDIAFDSPQGLEALRILRSFGAASPTDMTVNQARQAFNGGAMGILVRSSSGIQAVSESVGASFDLRFANFPVPAPQGRVVGAGNGLVMFARDPAKQRAAWEYMRFATGPHGQAILAQMTGYVPINMIAVRDPQYLGEFYRANPHQRMVGERLAIASDWYAFPNNPVRIFNAMTDELRRVLLQQTTPEQALATMASTARRLMREG